MCNKDVFDMNMNLSLHYKYDSKIYELREDLTESFELFEKQLDKFLDSKEKELLYNFKNNFYYHKQKFSDICIDIQDSIVLTVLFNSMDFINTFLGRTMTLFADVYLFSCFWVYARLITALP